jgi:hypothetical protein
VILDGELLCHRSRTNDRKRRSRGPVPKRAAALRPWLPRAAASQRSGPDRPTRLVDVAGQHIDKRAPRRRHDGGGPHPRRGPDGPGIVPDRGPEPVRRGVRFPPELEKRWILDSRRQGAEQMANMIPRTLLEITMELAGRVRHKFAARADREDRRTELPVKIGASLRDRRGGFAPPRWWAGAWLPS